MLISFSVSNFRSIRGEQQLSLIAGRERRHSERLRYCDPLRVRLLPIATIHGANGAGKSNLIRAIELSKSLITRIHQLDEKLPFQPYLLDDESVRGVTRFAYRIWLDDTVFDYLLEYNAESFTKEQLSVVDLRKAKNKATRILFSREAGQIHLENLASDAAERQALTVIQRTIPKNTTVLASLFQSSNNDSNSLYSWEDQIRNVYRWFTGCLSTLTPSVDFPSANTKVIKIASGLVPLFDTGVRDVRLVELKLTDLDMPQSFMETVRTKFPDGLEMPVPSRHSGHVSAILRKTAGELTAYETHTIHTKEDGQEIEFEISAESDGTVRLITLLSFLFKLAETSQPQVLVIDEIERSLHSLVVRKIINDFLEVAGQSFKSQLIFTTHDDTLFDSVDLRRDEIWLVDRSAEGTKLVSLGQKNLRFDLELMKRYRNGDFGGVANFADVNFVMKSLEVLRTLRNPNTATD